MKILYGVVGEGMGHAMRSRVVIEHLLQLGHEIEVVVSGRAHDYLQARFEGVHRIWGTTMVMSDNEVRKLGTAASLLRGATRGLPENIKQYLEMTRRFDPELVITDFETWTALYGYNHRLPVISIDNNQALRRLEHPPQILHERKSDWRIARSVCAAKVPHADHYIITSFFEAPPRKRRTSLVPPILRPEILSAVPSQGEHVLVYQTSESFQSLPRMLREHLPDVPFKIYGLRRDCDQPTTEGNLTFCPFSETGFVDDLASCRGVIASAGFTLISEALQLRKPYLATPVRGQFEQTMNARYIQSLGFGLARESLDPESLRGFIASLPSFCSALNAYPEQRDNARLFDTLGRVLDDVLT